MIYIQKTKNFNTQIKSKMKNNFITLVFLLTSYFSVAQNEADKDLTFNIGTGLNERAFTVTSQSDGKILIGGKFTTFNGVNRFRLIRLNINGTTDGTFFSWESFNNEIHAIKVQNDGKILIGGSFNLFNNQSNNGLIRLNQNGTKDTTFNTGTGFNSIFNPTATVYDIQTLNDGKILVCGYFTSYNGTTKNNIVKLNTDGSIDTSFNTNFFTNNGNSSNVILSKLSIQNDGKILLCGFFTTYNSISANNVLRLNSDGTKDLTFNFGSGLTSASNTTYCNSLNIQPDGKIILVGKFEQYYGIATKHIVRINNNGTLDTSFNIGSGFDLEATTLFIQSNLKIIVGGSFNSFNGINSNKIVRLNQDGSIDNAFNIGNGFNSWVYSICQLLDGSFLIGGNFTEYQSLSSPYIVKLKGLTALEINNFDEQNQVSIYPNPSKELININSINNQNFKYYKIYDLFGKIVSQKEMFENFINISQLNRGVYIIELINESENYKLKFIKN